MFQDFFTSVVSRSIGSHLQLKNSNTYSISSAAQKKQEVRDDKRKQVQIIIAQEAVGSGCSRAGATREREADGYGWVNMQFSFKTYQWISCQNSMTHKNYVANKAAEKARNHKK
eukprot:5362989-Ditylum_brightwellii.AAC.1